MLETDVQRGVYLKTRPSHVHRIGYSFGSASLGFAESSLAIFYLFYLTNVVGIGAGLAGAVFALPKVWDTFVDPVVGTWVDRQATRVGRRWPFVLVSGLLLYAAFIGMFSIPNLTSHWAVAGIAFALLIAFSTARTVFGICQLSVSTEIAADEAQLSSLYSLTLTVYTVVSLVGGSLPPLLVTWFGGGHLGYSLMAIFGAVMSCGFLVAYAMMTKSVPVQPVSEKAAAQSLVALFRATIKNNAFVALLAYYVVLCICTAIISSFLPYLNLYILHGDDTKLAVLSGIFNLTNILGFPLAPLFVRRYGARLALKVGNLIMIVAFVALFAASYLGLWTNWVVIGVVGVASGLLSVIFLSTLVDVSRAPVKGGLIVPLGFYFGVILSGTKLGQSGGNIVVGSLLGAAGFVSGAAHQSDLTLMAIRLGYTLLPALLFGMCGSFLNKLIRSTASQVPGTT
jgi:Na+/melibiose symporter-like transporter